MPSSSFFRMRIWRRSCVCNRTVAATTCAHIHKNQWNIATISDASRLRFNWCWEILLGSFLIIGTDDFSHCYWDSLLWYAVLYLLVSYLWIVWNTGVMLTHKSWRWFDSWSIIQLGFYLSSRSIIEHLPMNNDPESRHVKRCIKIHYRATEYVTAHNHASCVAMMYFLVDLPISLRNSTFGTFSLSLDSIWLSSV